MSAGAARIAYNFAVLRVVPHVFLGTFANLGVILHAPTTAFLDAQLLTDPAALRRCAPDVDQDLLLRYLHAYAAVCRGEESAGPVALLPPSERFHWLTAPRSDVLQSSPIHAGVTTDPGATLAALFESQVAAPLRRAIDP